MAEYDPNLPQEFAHMPKRHGLGPIMLIMALIAVFVLGGLFATLQHRTPSGEKAAAVTPAATIADPSAKPAE